MNDEKSWVHSNEKLGTPIIELGLSNRALNCLAGAEIETVEQLVKKKIDDLLKIRHLGLNTLAEIVKKVHESGFVRKK